MYLADGQPVAKALRLGRGGYKHGRGYEVIVDYLYSEQVDRAWVELQRLYLDSDLHQFRAQSEQAVTRAW